MLISDFITNFAAVFENVDISKFSSDTKFWELDEWSSLTALSVVSMIDEKYGVSLRGSDLKGVKTIGQLWEVVLNKTSN